MPKKTLSILGSTGSIGVSTLDVLARHPDRFRAVALTANTDAERLAEQCRQHRPRYAVMVDPAAARRLSELLADMPEEKPKAEAPAAGLPQGMLKAAMAGSKQPDVTADAGDDDEGTGKVDPEEARAQAALAMIR